MMTTTAKARVADACIRRGSDDGGTTSSAYADVTEVRDLGPETRCAGDP
jgi:hypothetical protein